MTLHSKTAGPSKMLLSLNKLLSLVVSYPLKRRHHPLFYFNQTIVGPFDVLQHLLCAWISFALCALMRKIRSFDVLTKAQ